MLEVLFGWSKASRCKKLIRQVQCRLKLLKNKRSSIVRQLRDDVAQLLKHGHEQLAFDRVEQIFLDESIVAVYDLLDHFCEFIILNLSYIRKHKDCREDIGEAVSTLIFASARCGNIPELKKIRKLFGERYGHSFAEVALELLPGNLVNFQIMENLSIQSVANDIKWSLVNDIWRSCLSTGPLAIEYYPEIQQEQAIKNWEDEVVESDVQSKYTTNDEPQMQTFSITEEEGKIVYVDSQSSYQESSINSTSTLSAMIMNSSPRSFELSINTYNGDNITEKKEVDMGVESSSDSSPEWPKELVYVDDIEEYKSPMSTHVNSQDQRLFMFKSSVIISTNKLERDLNESYIDKSSSPNEKSGLRRFRKSKRQRRRSLSRESSSVKDYESTIYYGEGDESSRKSDHRKKKHQKKMQIFELARIDNDASKIKGVVHSCNLVQPCYVCTSDDQYGLESRMITTKRFVEGLGDDISNKKETKSPYLRIMTMPPQRTNDAHDENMVRSNSVPFQKQKDGSSNCRHVHPKLPDCDELEATFMALKKANSQIKNK